MSAPVLERDHAPLAPPPSIERFVDEALEDALREQAIAVVRVPAPRASLETPLRVLRKSTSIAWRPPEGAAISGVGRAVELVLSGPDRFRAIDAASDALFSRMLRRTHPDAIDAPPRLFGGWSFAEDSAEDAPWEGFGDGRFVLPRFCYEHAGGRASLTLAVDLRDGWAGRIPLVRSELAALLAALRAPARVDPPRPRVVRVDRPSRASWDALVRGITGAVRSGALEKAVASRRVEVRTEHDLDPWLVLRDLSARYPSTFRFGVRFEGGAFIGATPERLFEKRGRTLRTDALAGSISASAGDAERVLAASEKDRREHRPVIAHLLARLGPLCESLEAGEPTVRRLPNVLHLHTSVRGTLHPGAQAGAIAAALHPTPAVGGMPVGAAVSHIVSHEPHRRGWYCGPVGWIDASGDAELVVALRCGVVRGASAWLYSGGGIVEGSVASAEWDECELKLEPLLDALGAP